MFHVLGQPQCGIFWPQPTSAEKVAQGATLACSTLLHCGIRTGALDNVAQKQVQHVLFAFTKKDGTINKIKIRGTKIKYLRYSLYCMGNSTTVVQQ